jgi:hypothetical protein
MKTHELQMASCANCGTVWKLRDRMTCPVCVGWRWKEGDVRVPKFPKGDLRNERAVPYFPPQKSYQLEIFFPSQQTEAEQLTH